MSLEGLRWPSEGSVSYFALLAVLEIEPRASGMPGKHSVTEIQSQPSNPILYMAVVNLDLVLMIVQPAPQPFMLLSLEFKGPCGRGYF